jgi:hypothetical protein
LKTLLIELRYRSAQGRYERYDDLVNGMNDIVVEIAHRFTLNILSVSHIVESQRYTSIICTAVCALNEFTADQIGKTLQEEKHPDTNLSCFLDASGFKLSIHVSEIKNTNTNISI